VVDSTSATHPPTPEQQQAIDLFTTGGHVVIKAGAGTGKTTTLAMCARSTHRTGTYLAFNRAIAFDAERAMPNTVDCRTVHSIAYRAMRQTPEGSRLLDRINSPRVAPHQMARRLGLGHLVVEIPQPATGTRSKVLQPGWQASHIMRAIAAFCDSGDTDPGPQHFPYVDGIDPPADGGRRTYVNNRQVTKELTPALLDAWGDLTNPDGALRFTHGVYIKMWQLARRQVPADYVFFDEAQDANGVMIAAMTHQDAQLVWVGDDQQQIYCQPPGTIVRVATCIDGRTWGTDERSIEDLQPGDRVVSWGGSWRLGAIHRRGSMVTDSWSQPFKGRLITVETASGLRSRYTPDHHCVVMLGMPCHDRWVVYMMRQGDRYRVGACQGQYGSQHDAFGPIVRARQERADAIWVLSQHASKAAALSAEALCHRSVPSRCFESSGGYEWWNARRSNDRQMVESLLAGYGLSVDAPLLERTGSWLDRTRTPFVTQARNLLDGMFVLPIDNAVIKNRSATVRKTSWEPIIVSQEPYEGEVVSITVADDHTYVADGIVTHNSWRGAVNAMDTVSPDVPRTYLTQSWRFGPAIADAANHVLERLDADLRLRGTRSVPSEVLLAGRAPRSRAVLCRSNAAAVQNVLNYQAEGLAPTLVGGSDDIVRFAKAADQLMDTGRTSHPELCCFDSWRQVQDYVDQDPHGADLKMLVGLIDKYGPDVIVQALDGLADEREADVVVSTAHKAKGREWRSVRLGTDFEPPEHVGLPNGEWRLLYVAATRATHTLDLTGCFPLRDLLTDAPRSAVAHR
jgi:hypothetical protein